MVLQKNISKDGKYINIKIIYETKIITGGT